MKKGWERKILKEVCSVFTDGDWIETKDQASEGIRLIQTGNIGFGIFKNKEEKSRYISEETFNKLNCTEVQVGDLLISRLPDPVGKSCIIPNLNTKMITGVDCTIVRPKSYLLSEYLAYYQISNQYINDVKARVTGTTRSRISRKNLGLIRIPIPPLAEQQQIVEILDEAFAAIDQAQANIEKNIENAKELFQSKLNDIFSKKGEGWEERRIIELCDHKSQIVGGPFGSNLKVKDYKQSGVPILRLQNIGKGYFIDKDIKYISDKKAKELEYHSFVAGDIVLAKLGIPIGKTCIVPEEFSFGIVVADVVRIRPNKNEVDYDFLKHFLNSDASVNQLSADIRGATRPRVNISEVRNLQLSVPSIEKQVEIRKYIDVLETYRNDLIASYKSKLINLDNLKKSILEKAFSGELTATTDNIDN